MRISDWSSDVCSSDLRQRVTRRRRRAGDRAGTDRDCRRTLVRLRVLAERNAATAADRGAAVGAARQRRTAAGAQAAATAAGLGRFGEAVVSKIGRAAAG